MRMGMGIRCWKLPLHFTVSSAPCKMPDFTAPRGMTSPGRQSRQKSAPSQPSSQGEDRNGCVTLTGGSVPVPGELCSHPSPLSEAGTSAGLRGNEKRQRGAKPARSRLGAHVAPSVPVWGSAVPRPPSETPLSALREIFSDLKACNGWDFAGHREPEGLRGSIRLRQPLPSTGVAEGWRWLRWGRSHEAARVLSPL